MCGWLETTHVDHENHRRTESCSWMFFDYILVCPGSEDRCELNLIFDRSVALTMFRIDALRWTPHMEESLQILLDAKECPEDELLVTLVKIQLVMDKVHYLRRDGDGQPPPPIYTKSFQAQLESVKGQIPQNLKQDSTFNQPATSTGPQKLTPEP